MAKKKQPEPQQEQDKIFEVIPAVYEQFNWPIGWSNQDREVLENILIEAVSDLGYFPNAPQDFILHETLNSFKGNSDNLKAFLFLDTAEYGGMSVGSGNNINQFVGAAKGKLVILKGYDYSFSSTPSKKRRVLELIF
jgi:hypothetical protein